MDKPEQVGDTHENFSDLLHAIDPRTLIRMIAAAAGIVVGELLEVRYRNPRVQIAGLVKPAARKIVDGVYTVHAADRGVVEIWLFEIELSFNAEKRRTWSLYVVAFEREFDADGQLAVFAPQPALRERIRAKIIPRTKIKPILIEPDQIERITDYDEARRRPELTILGCLFHAQEPAPFEDQVAVFRAAVLAILSLDRERVWRYGALVMDIAPQEVIMRGLAALRESGDLDEKRYRQISETARCGGSFQMGRAEGREEARREGLQRMLVEVLQIRGFALTDAQRERIASCDTLETLERWFVAVKVAAANQLVDEILD